MSYPVYRAIILLLLLSPVIFFSCQQPVIEPAASGKYRLVWNDDPATTMTVIWDQLKGTDPKVYYGKMDFGRNYTEYALVQEPTRKLLNYYGMNTYFAEIKNLDPDQNYYFVIKDEFGVSRRYYFRTAPDKPKAFTFICGGDTKSSGNLLAAGRSSNRMVSKLSPLFVIFFGDFNDGNGTDPYRWRQWLEDWDSLTTTPQGRKTPIIPIHGNHENRNKSILHKLFNTPFQFNDSTNIFYSLSFGNDLVHIMALNSEIEEGGKQREWIEKNLKNKQNYRLKIAAYHKPFRPHTLKKREQDYQYSQWAQLFYDYGLSLSLDGDSHLHKITYPLRPSDAKGSFQGFIRDDERGTVFLGEGSWGAQPRKNNDDKPWTLQSGSFNQIKWIHVVPQNEASISVEIFTIITASYHNGVLRLHGNDTEFLGDDDPFKIPQNLNLFNPDGKTPSIKFTFNN